MVRLRSRFIVTFTVAVELWTGRFADLEEDFFEARVCDAVAGNIQLTERSIERSEQLLKAALFSLVERQDVVQFVTRLCF